MEHIDYELQFQEEFYHDLNKSEMEYTKIEYERYLNRLYHIDEVLEKTEHCWAGNDKSSIDKKCAKAYAMRGEYGAVLRNFDPVAFNTGYNEWKRKNTGKL